MASLAISEDDQETVRITAGALKLDGNEAAVNLMSFPRLLQAKTVLIEAADCVLDIPDRGSLEAFKWRSLDFMYSG